MIRFRRLLVIFPIVFLISFVFAEGTRTWEQSKFDELIKGTPKGVAIRSTGGLELAPAFTALYDDPVDLHLVNRRGSRRQHLRSRWLAGAGLSNYSRWKVDQ